VCTNHKPTDAVVEDESVSINEDGRHQRATGSDTVALYLALNGSDVNCCRKIQTHHPRRNGFELWIVGTDCREGGGKRINENEGSKDYVHDTNFKYDYSLTSVSWMELLLSSPKPERTLVFPFVDVIRFD
jgi:hypothetical protein